MKTSCSGKSMLSACRCKSCRRTPCILIRSKPSVTVVSKPATRNFFCWSSVCNAMALSLPPLQQKRIGSRMFSALSGKAIFHANAHFPPQCRISQCVLVLLVEKILHADVSTEAFSKIVRRGQIETRVAGISGESKEEKIRIGSFASEISGECEDKRPV